MSKPHFWLLGLLAIQLNSLKTASHPWSSQHYYNWQIKKLSQHFESTVPLIPLIHTIVQIKLFTALSPPQGNMWILLWYLLDFTHCLVAITSCSLLHTKSWHLLAQRYISDRYHWLELWKRLPVILKSLFLHIFLVNKTSIFLTGHKAS